MARSDNLSDRRAIAAGESLYSAWARDVGEVSCLYPELSLRLYAGLEGMNLQLLMYLPGTRTERRVVCLREALWQPATATEGQVLDWARRALESVILERIGSSEG